jgi:hypothetical protein
VNKCNIDGTIENESIRFVEVNGTFLMYLPNRKIYITTDDFVNCPIGDNVRFVFDMVDEPIKKKIINTPSMPSDDTSFYSAEPNPIDLSLKIEPIMYTQTRENKPIQEPDLPFDFTGLVASSALVLAIIQQAYQKKKQAESAKCCSDSKVKISQLDSEIKRLETKIETKNEESSKALHAEIIEQYKEMKELRDDANDVKEVVQRLIDREKRSGD